MATHMYHISFRTITTILAFTIYLLICGAALAHKSPTPEDFNGYLVFMTNGEVPADEPVFFTDEFFTDIMGWSPQELEAYTAERLAFIEERFGIIDPANNPDVAVLTFMTNPAANYRAYTVGGRKVPKQGWPIREGAIMVVVTNPAGLDLGGEFAGTHLPVNGFVPVGFYNIEVTNKHGVPTGEEIIIEFQASQPMIPIGGAFGQLSAFCEIENEQWGKGSRKG